MVHSHKSIQPWRITYKQVLMKQENAHDKILRKKIPQNWFQCLKMNLKKIQSK